MSLMPISLYIRASFVDLQLTNLTIQLADHSIKAPVGLFEDV